MEKKIVVLESRKQKTENRMWKIVKSPHVIFIVSCLLFFVAPLAAQAAVLSFSPASGFHAVGSTFAVNVYVSSTDQAINAVSGTISFPQNNLEITSLSKTGSIINTWVQDPSFSNTAGTADFQGIIFNPGFTGASGQIITINFKVKSVGAALVNFSSGSVLANDGNGTETLKSSGSAQFDLSAAAPTAPPKKINPPVAAPAVNLPPSPQISSPTHPDSSKWYSNNAPEFVWQLTPDIIAVRSSYNKYPSSQPTVVHKPAISEIDMANLKDGVYYFHAQLENSAGWGPVSHFRFQIDTQPPEPFVISLIDGKETDNPQPTISFKTTDALSGIDYYKIKINNGNFFVIPPEQIINDSYVLPLQMPGLKTILVMAVDRAGNYAVAYVEFTIKSINPPVITDYPQKLENNEPLAIKGQSYPDSKIIIWHQGENEGAESQTTTSDDAGYFTFTANENFKNGVYTIWAQVVDKRGAISDNSEKITIIEHRSIFFEIKSWIVGNIITTYLCVILVCLLLILLIIRAYNSKFSQKVHKS